MIYVCQSKVKLPLLLLFTRSRLCCCLWRGDSGKETLWKNFLEVTDDLRNAENLRKSLSSSLPSFPQLTKIYSYSHHTEGSSLTIDSASKFIQILAIWHMNQLTQTFSLRLNLRLTSFVTNRNRLLIKLKIMPNKLRKDKFCGR